MLKIVKGVSKKGFPYYALVYDTGVSTVYLTFDKLKILEVANITCGELDNFFLQDTNAYYCIK